MSEQFSDPEQALIERLRRAPQPELSSEIREAILSQVLAALEHPPLPVPRPRLLQPIAIIAIVVIVGTFIAGGILFVLSRQNQNVPPPSPTATLEPSLSPSPTATISPTPTDAATVTIESTVTPAPTTVVPAVVSSPVLTETLLPTLTLTSTVQLTVSPTMLPTTSVNTLIVVEGPVQAINVNVITIYNIPIQIDPNNPILKTISIGDHLRIEGSSLGGTREIRIIATTVVIVNVEVNADGNTGGDANPPASSGNGEVWSDDGSCAHPPPDWAPANGWRRRCQGQESNNNGHGNDGNNGNGNGNGNNGKPNKNNP